MFSVVIPTIGRDSLPKTLDAIPSGVEVLIVADTHGPLLTDVRAIAEAYGARYLEHDAGYHDTGSPQLQLGYAEATGRYIQNMGDDDVMEPYAFEAMQRAIEEVGEPMPLMFRTVLHPTWPDPRRGNRQPVVLWGDPEIRDKNVTGQCFVTPNDQSKIGRWDILVDYGFIESTVALWGGKVAWRTEIISQCW